jgi:hypothetical protein
MFTLSFVFFLFLFIFGCIGALRGWGKELLVTFSLILALFIIQVLQAYVPPVARMLASSDPKTQFFLWSIVVCFFALVGYHTPRIHKMAAIKMMHNDRLQDWLLGGIIGLINGYLLIGTLWWYLHEANYPFSAQYMLAPQAGTPTGDWAIKIVSFMPPTWLGVPVIYFAVALAFAIVVIAFI